MCSRLTADLLHLRQLLHDEKEAAAAVLGSNSTVIPGSNSNIATASREQLQHGLSVALAAQAKERARNAELVHRLQQLHSEHVDVLALQRQYLELQDAHYQQVCTKKMKWYHAGYIVTSRVLALICCCNT